MAFYSCQNKENSKNIVKTIVQDTLLKTIGGTADLSDAPPRDDKAVEVIRKQLNILLETMDDDYFNFDRSSDSLTEMENKLNKLLKDYCQNSYYCHRSSNITVLVEWYESQ